MRCLDICSTIRNEKATRKVCKAISCRHSRAFSEVFLLTLHSRGFEFAKWRLPFLLASSARLWFGNLDRAGYRRQPMWLGVHDHTCMRRTRKNHCILPAGPSTFSPQTAADSLKDTVKLLDKAFQSGWWNITHLAVPIVGTLPQFFGRLRKPTADRAPST